VRPAGTGEQCLHRLGQPDPGAWWPGHQQWRGPVGELAVENQERQPTEVITMQVGYRHRTDRMRVQPLGLQRHQTGGTAVDQQHLSFSGQVNARLPAPAAAEGITAAHEPNPHGSILAQPAGQLLRHVRGVGHLQVRRPARRAAAIVKATTFHDDPDVVAKVSRGLGEAMAGISTDTLAPAERYAGRGW
jgi:hypothetical protein